MATLYKKKRDQGKKGACWYFDFTDENGKRRSRKGFTDKGLTAQAAAKAENEVMLRKRGLIDPAAERIVERKRRPLAEHLTAYEKTLSKTTPKHIKQTVNRIRRMIVGCAFVTAGQIDAEKLREWLVAFCEKEKLGHRTYNHYVQAFGGFCLWMVETGRLASNPVAAMDILNAAVDVRHPRRALSPEEFSKLVASARQSGESIQCFDGEQRSRIYILSYMTGLRRKEIASLTPRSFDLAAVPPTVTVAAACSKHRRTDVLPLHPELVTMLQEWLRNVPADAVLFPRLARRRTWLMVKKDLERIGIPYVTPEGIADFHAAGRHTHITQLLRNGATLPEAKELARHTDVKMTMRYTHIGIDDQAKAVRSIPCPWIGSDSAVPKGQSEASSVTARHHDTDGGGDVSAGTVARCGTNRQKRTPPVKGGVQWRRRESNPRPVTFPRLHLRAYSHAFTPSPERPAATRFCSG